MKQNKKSQMEILGLAVVVVLVIIAMLFAVRLSFKEPPKHRQAFVNRELATNMLNTFLNMNARECSDMTITDLLQNCAMSSSDTGIECDNSERSCEFVKTKAEEIFGKTLGAWNIGYKFKATLPNGQAVVKIIDQMCTQQESEIFLIPVDPSNSISLAVQLDICK